MNPDAQREAALFLAAAQLIGAARASFLDSACQGNPAMRQRLEALLAAHEQAEGVLEETAPAAKPTIKLDPADAPDEAVGQTLGRYKLLERVGEGGCGVVYVAEQTEPVRRRVALKVIKLGMDTKQVVARFEAERQALAMMDHPNIAKVLDAGTTDVGHPFFVMELVRGIKITDYCDQANLTTMERLDLFIKVCQAIQHAHQKGIIHRDIKPSNILVTLHDGVPVPKVIDFGIAKATEGRLTDATVYTQLHQLIGTPAYMSPEQAEMSGLDIDTRSDIYSLGVLLYELLAGSTPFDAKELMASGIDAMRKTIREKEPVRPSTRLATLKGEDLTTTAKRRSAEAPKLIHLLKGDLDWIVMKCLEKDRTRRYETANGLAADLKRHLNNEPVVARPPSTAYQFQKAFRRNKLVFTAGAAVVAALVIGIAASSWQAIRATRAERKAVRAQRNEAEERQRAVQNELAVRQSLYAAQMSQALDAWFDADLVRAKDLLDRQRPRSGEKDLRGLEWRILWQQCRPSGAGSIMGPADFSILGAPDDRTLVVANSDGAWLYDIVSRLEVTRVDGTWSQASRDARYVAVETRNKSVVLWDVSERREIASCRRPELSSPIFLSSDGAQLAFLTTNGVVKIWNFFSNILSAELSWKPKTGFGPFFINATRIAFCATDHLQVWDIAAKQPAMSVPLSRNDLIGNPLLTADGAFVACVLPDNTAAVWEVASGRKVASLSGHTGRINGMRVSPDDQLLVTISDDATAKVWSRVNWTEIMTLRGHASAIYSLEFSPDGRLLATGGNDQAIKVWSLSERTDVATFRGHTADVRRLAFSTVGRTLISRSTDGAIRFWDVTSLKDDSILGKHGSWVRSVAFSRDGVLASGSWDGCIKLWDTASRQEIALLREPDGKMVCNLAFSPDGRTLASGHSDGSVRLWNVETRQEIETLPVKGNGWWILKLSFSPDGRTLAFGCEGNKALLWDLVARRFAGCIGGFENLVVVTAFSPDGKILATGESDGTVTFFDTATTNHLWRVTHPTQMLMDLNFSPDGKLLATAGWDRLAKLWDLSNKSHLVTLKGHRGVVDTAVFSPDSKTVVTAGADSTVKLWRVDMQLEVGTLRGHTSPTTTAAFSPDGTLLATAGGDKTIRLWRAPSWEQIIAEEAKEKAESKQP